MAGNHEPRLGQEFKCREVPLGNLKGARVMACPGRFDGDEARQRHPERKFDSIRMVLFVLERRPQGITQSP